MIDIAEFTPETKAIFARLMADLPTLPTCVEMKERRAMVNEIAWIEARLIEQDAEIAALKKLLGED